MLDYHRRQHDAYRYGSSGTLSTSHQELFPGGGSGGGGGAVGGCCGGGGAGRYMPPPPPIGYCSHDPRVSGPIPWMADSGQVRIDSKLTAIVSLKTCLILLIVCVRVLFSNLQR